MWITVVRRPTLNEGGRHHAMARDPGANKGDSKRWYSCLSASLLHMANSVPTSLCFRFAETRWSAAQAAVAMPSLKLTAPLS